MKRFLGIAAMLAAVASAQETAPRRTVMPAMGNMVMGKAVKSAPYSADEVTESQQLLGDGTRINRQSQVSVYRDGEGRVRRETPDSITIWDPVANTSYTLDPKAKTARKSTMSFVSFKTVAPQGSSDATFNVMVRTPDTQPATGWQTVELDAVKQKLSVLSGEMSAASGKQVTINGTAAGVELEATLKEQLATVRDGIKTPLKNNLKTEALGKQTFWGVAADGTKTTSTIEAGQIGNDRPIAIVTERWFSEELQTLVMSKHSDPRTGDEIFRLTNVRRGEPGSDLFMVPTGYTMVEGGGAIKLMPQQVK